MQHLVILAGLPGSGKSTRAAQLKADRGFFVVSLDGLRLALNAGVYPRGDDFNTLGPVVRDLAERAVAELLRRGRDVAIDATNLTRARRRRWRELARAVNPGVRVTIWWCGGAFDSAGRWAAERGVPADEYAALRREQEAIVEVPAADEADEVVN